MGAFSNAINRVPYTRDPALEFDIYGPSDWPALILAPDGEMRAPLVEGAIYKVHNTHIIPKMLWPKATSFTTFAPTEITGARLAVSLLVFGTAGIPHFWGREVGVIALNRVSAVDIADGGDGKTSTLYNFTGGTLFSILLANLFAPINFKKLGNLVELGMNISNSAWNNNIQGVVQRLDPGNSLFNQIQTLVFNTLGGGAALKPQYAILGSPAVMLQLGNNVELKPGDNLYYIDSAVPSASNLVFSSHPYAGPAKGNFFRPDFSGTITAMVQKDLVINSFSDSSVNPGVDTTVNLAAITKHTKGEEILIADEAAYDGLRTILRVADDQLSFDINVVFSTSGAGTLKATEFTTSGNNPIVESETVTVVDTTSYNGTLKTTIVSDTTFELPIPFVGNDATGTVTSTSKDSESIGVLSLGNGAQRDSMIAGGWNLIANSSATTVESGVFNDIDFTGSVPFSYNERITLIDPINGACRYDGLNPSDVNIPLEFYLIPNNNSDREYDFKLLIDTGSGFVDLPDNVVTRKNIKGTNDSVDTSRTVLLSPGDEYKWVQSGVGTTNGFTAASGSSSI